MATIFDKIIRIREQGAKQTENRLASMIKTGLSIGAVTVAFKAFANQMKAASQAAMEQEAIFKKLETAVNLSGVSYNKNEKALKDLFAQQQKYTKYGDTDSAEMLSRLIQLSGDYEGSVKALETAQDLASTGMFDMNTAARYVGMALAGNVEMLGRYIPELRAGSAGMEGLTTKAEKTEYAMKLLNEKFGGTARAELDTYAGQIAQLKNYVGDYQEMIGDKLNPVLKKGAERLTEFFKRATETSLETTIRQLKELGASAEELQRLQSLSDMENYFKTYAQQIQQIEREYEKIGLTYDKEVLELLGKGIDYVESGNKATNETLKLYDELAPNQEKYNTSLYNMSKMTSSNVDNFKSMVVTVDRNRLSVENLDKAIEYLEKQAIGYGVSYKEATDKGRESIKKNIDENAKQINKLREIKNLIIASAKVEEGFDTAVNDTTGELSEQEKAAKLLNAELEKLAIKYELTAGQIEDFKKALSAPITAVDLSQDVDFRLGIKTPIDTLIKDARAEIANKLESGEISEQTAIALNAQLDEKAIEEGILQPLEEIEVPNIEIYTDEALQTDMQRFQEFADKYRQEIDTFASAASGIGQVWENIVEGNYNKELKALKDTAKYQRATNDERKVMEQDLYDSFAEEREKYAKYQKGVAIAEATINAALAVSKFLAMGNTVGAIAAGALGAVQVGVISTEPIPQYASGGIIDRPQIAMIGESGTEAVLNPTALQTLGVGAVNDLNAGKAVGHTMYININNPLLLENGQVDLLAQMIADRARQGFNDLEVKYN